MQAYTLCTKVCVEPAVQGHPRLLTSVPIESTYMQHAIIEPQRLQHIQGKRLHQAPARGLQCTRKSAVTREQKNSERFTKTIISQNIKRLSTLTVAYLREHGAMSPLWPDHEIFYRRLYMKRCVLPVSSKNCKIQQCLMVVFHTDTICD